MNYMNVQETARKWKISERRVRQLCSEKKIPGVILEGRSYKIPNNAKKPADARLSVKNIPQRYQEIFSSIDRKKI